MVTPFNNAWTEYDQAADWCAKRGLRGSVGDQLPQCMGATTVQLINEDPEAFQLRVQAFAYERAMRGTLPFQLDRLPADDGTAVEVRGEGGAT